MSSSIERPEDDLRTVVDLTPFMLARCSADLRYRFVSDACAKMLGYRPADIVGQRIVDILGEEGFREILPYIQEVLKGLGASMRPMFITNRSASAMYE